MNILEGKEKLKETSEKFGEKLSEGEQIQKEGEETDRIAASIDTTGLDSDTIDTARNVTSDLSSAYTEKIGEVEKEVDRISDTAQENVNDLGKNREQVDRNAEKYSDMAGVSEIGRAAADAGRSKMESDSRQYSDLIQENETQMEQSRERAKNMSSVIGGLFKRG
jgi:methyl-accepting chemotaxis protein